MSEVHTKLDIAVEPIVVPSSVTVEWVTITPDLAKLFLEKNDTNRKISELRVNRMVSDVVNGRFVVNGATIVFSVDGTLLDGQHRLNMIIESGVSVPFLVVRGIPRPNFETIDSGKSRSVKDILDINDIPNGSILSSAIRMTEGWYEQRSMNSGNTIYSNQEIVEFTHENPYVVELTALVKSSRGKIPAAPLAAVLFLATRNGNYRTEKDKFLNALKTGENLKVGDPIHTLREWSMGITNSRRFTSTEVFAAIAKAWNAFIQKRSLKQLHPYVYPEFIEGADYKHIGKKGEFRKAVRTAIEQNALQTHTA